MHTVCERVKERVGVMCVVCAHPCVVAHFPGEYAIPRYLSLETGYLTKREAMAIAHQPCRLPVSKTHSIGDTGMC